MIADAFYMRKALQLARRAEGRTAPNPMVGAVVVRDGGVVGLGWHHRAGEPHAEVLALRQAGERARGATLYVSLEPCCHHGRTPPCTDAVLSAGVARVVAAMEDPFPRVSGEGVRLLRAAGLEMTVGVLEEEARELNRAFVKAVATGLPWCTLKIAATLDGRIADRSGASRWITGEDARRAAHRMRDRHDAVIVGIGTVRKDDPELTARLPGARTPWRVVVDARAELPATSRLVRTAREHPLLLLTGPESDARALEVLGAHVERVPLVQGRVELEAALRALVRRGLHSVLCEGGASLAAALLESGLVDRVAWFAAPRLLVDGRGRPALDGTRAVPMASTIPLTRCKCRRVGEDYLITGDVYRDR